jgi:hypothetical protein
MTTSLERCLAYLETLPPAISGSGGSRAEMEAVLACRRFGLSDGDTWQALTWFNDNRCNPPWSEKELRHKMAANIQVRKPLGRGGKIMVKPITGDELKKLSGKRKRTPPSLEDAYRAMRADASPEHCRRYAEAAIAAGMPFWDDGNDLGAAGWRQWAG